VLNVNYFSGERINRSPGGQFGLSVCEFGRYNDIYAVACISKLAERAVEVGFDVAIYGNLLGCRKAMRVAELSKGGCTRNDIGFAEGFDSVVDVNHIVIPFKNKFIN
jgi:hypothetical protein